MLPALTDRQTDGHFGQQQYPSLKGKNVLARNNKIIQAKKFPYFPINKGQFHTVANYQSFR